MQLTTEWGNQINADTYTLHEQAMVTSFLETYFKVVKLVAQHQWSVNKAGAIKTLKSRTMQIDVGYMQNLIRVNTFTEYFNLLAQYYKWTGEDRKAASCDTHILNIIHGQLKHCSPDCDYLSISIAYENIGDRMQAFEFRKLAYQHQLQSWKKRNLFLTCTMTTQMNSTKVQNPRRNS